MPFRESGFRLVRAEEMSKEASESEASFSSSGAEDEQDTPTSSAMVAARRFLDIRKVVCDQVSRPSSGLDLLDLLAKIKNNII